MSDAITVEKFIDALEPIKHDREENTLLLSIPLDVWEKYMSGTTNGTNEGERGMNQDELIEALVKFTEQTGMEWESMLGNDFRAPNEFGVLFTNVKETEDD